ncbi:MAG: formylglycine-generating enzyme family protein [Polyangiaceae bacterium]|jgi:hypothetical protein|nr:formylglycine-generating enzyme family protein [Polyangiaceae bacterium]
MEVCQGSACGAHPQVCVDWCDAQASCRSVGKRVCGQIGGGGLAWSVGGEASRSQWYNASSGGRASKYTYGSQYDDNACNGRCTNASSSCESRCCTTNAATFYPACHGAQAPFGGMWDMGGNVVEFEDACGEATGPGVDICRIRRGNYWSGENLMACDRGSYANDEGGRSGGCAYVGFRHCAP